MPMELRLEFGTIISLYYLGSKRELVAGVATLCLYSCPVIKVTTTRLGSKAFSCAHFSVFYFRISANLVA